MAYSTIPKSSSYFNTVTYTGNGTASTALTTGTFQPDFCWFKNRGTVENHVLINAIRGASYNIASNLTRAETNVPDKVSAFTSTGVTLGSSAETNENNEPLVAWNWKANGSGSANGDGSINSTVSVDTTSGFSIVSYTGTGSNATVGHGLGVAPSMIITKSLVATQEWCVYHKSLGATKYLFLNETSAEQTGSVYWQDTAPTSSVFSIGASGPTNSTSAMIAYCFADIQGYSKFGSYYGNGGSGEPFIYTGFKPAFIITRNVTSAVNWGMFDDKRNPFNVVQNVLLPDNSASETTGTAKYFDFLSNGFKVKNDSLQYNGTNEKHIYMAFGQPIVSTNGDIATAR
jgi:hypothetical protein